MDLTRTVYLLLFNSDKRTPQMIEVYLAQSPQCPMVTAQYAVDADIAAKIMDVR